MNYNLNVKLLISTLLCLLSLHMTHADEKLKITEVSLTSIIESFSQSHKKVIIANDGILASLKSRSAKIVLPESLAKRNVNAELWQQVFENLLSIYGYALIDKGDVFHLVPSRDAAKIPTPIIANQTYEFNDKSQRIVTHVIQLKHTVSDVIRPLFRYVQDVTTPLALPDKKTLVVTASESSINFFMDLVNIVDREVEMPHIKVFKIEYASPEEIKSHIQGYFTVLKAHKKGAVDISQKPYLLADEKNRQILASAISEDQDIIERMIKFLDSDRHLNFQSK